MRHCLSSRDGVTACKFLYRRLIRFPHINCMEQLSTVVTSEVDEIKKVKTN